MIVFEQNWKIKSQTTHCIVYNHKEHPLKIGLTASYSTLKREIIIYGVSDHTYTVCVPVLYLVNETNKHSVLIITPHFWPHRNQKQFFQLCELLLKGTFWGVGYILIALYVKIGRVTYRFKGHCTFIILPLKVGYCNF